MEISKFLNEKLSLEYIKSELVRTAYGVEDNFLTKLDPRVLTNLVLLFCHCSLVYS